MHDTFPTHDQDPYHGALLRLGEAVRAPENIVYAEGRGILPIELVEEDRIADPVFRDVIERVGWPEQASDSIIESVHEFVTAREFLESHRFDDGMGQRWLGTSHFMNLVSHGPINEPSEADDSIQRLIGLYPVVHRAHAVSPDFFGPLLQVLEAIDTLSGKGNRITDTTYEQIVKPGNEDVVTAIYMAYRIMGRLLKVDDHDRLLKTLGGGQSRHESPVLSAHSELIYGS